MTVHDFSVRAIDGAERSMGEYRGATLLVVNVASRCGYTPQYAGLETLYRKYRSRGFVVLGFPCNQFGRQEPGTETDIREFCRATYDITFPLFAKVEVNGAGAHPLFEFLKSARPGILGTTRIKWNFTKFLIAPDGAVVRRYGPTATPDTIDADVVELLP